MSIEVKDVIEVVKVMEVSKLLKVKGCSFFKKNVNFFATSKNLF
jgi:hypothetical protein